jgi:hypothetical protein
MLKFVHMLTALSFGVVAAVACGATLLLDASPGGQANAASPPPRLEPAKADPGLVAGDRAAPGPGRDDASPAVPTGRPHAAEAEVALRYVRAVADSDAETVIDLTQWMQERLQRVRAGAGDSGAAAAARVRLVRSIQERRTERNHLRPEGMEDTYVFAPGADFEVVDDDEGPKGLARPVARRVWVRVRYPRAADAPHDAAGRPISELVAGVSVSDGGRVLKASIVGNAEIDRESIRHDWPATTEG